MFLIVMMVQCKDEEGSERKVSVSFKILQGS